MAIADQYKKPLIRLSSIDYFCGLFAVSTFVALCLRGLVLGYDGIFSIIIWVWLLLLTVYLIKISREILDINIFYNQFINSRLNFILLYKHLNIIILTLTLVITTNIWLHFI
jgi:hypothetical protein